MKSLKERAALAAFLLDLVESGIGIPEDVSLRVGPVRERHADT